MQEDSHSLELLTKNMAIASRLPPDNLLRAELAHYKHGVKEMAEYEDIADRLVMKLNGVQNALNDPNRHNPLDVLDATSEMGVLNLTERANLKAYLVRIAKA